MLKGLTLTPPIVGRISIGRVVEKNGKRLPEKDDEFTVTSQVQAKGGWIPHPADVSLRKQCGGKLRNIPIRLVFNDPDLNFRASYSLFDRATGRPLCVGNGDTCRRSTASGIQPFPCPAPEGCELARGGACKPYGRLNVRIGDEEDDFGCFIFRTTGFNSIRTISTRLLYFASVSGGFLATLPLELRLRGKSTTQSHRAPIYYVDLTVRAGMTLEQSVVEARKRDQQRQESGIDQAALERAAREGLAQGAFEESEEEGRAVVEEFYPAEAQQAGKAPVAEEETTLALRLAGRVRRSNRLERPNPVTVSSVGARSSRQAQAPALDTGQPSISNSPIGQSEA